MLYIKGRKGERESSSKLDSRNPWSSLVTLLISQNEIFIDMSVYLYAYMPLFGAALNNSLNTKTEFV